MSDFTPPGLPPTVDLPAFEYRRQDRTYAGTPPKSTGSIRLEELIARIDVMSNVTVLMAVLLHDTPANSKPPVTIR